MAQDQALQPFHAHVDQARLDDLRERLTRVRWAEELPDVGWDYGTPVAFLRPLVQRWLTDFDWRAVETRINSFPQFTTVIDGQTVHFVHVRSPRADAFPLIVGHGWPGSFTEYLDLAEPLTDPANGAPAFDLVIPSLPGFGFSGPTHERGWNYERIARVWIELMERLGYQRYGVVGNDWSAFIAPEVGRFAPERVAGVHVQQIWSLPSGRPGELDDLSPRDSAVLAGYRQFQASTGAYDLVHSAVPQTLAHALTDSPVGLLAWNSQLWRDKVSADFTLTNVSLYWLTDTVSSSMRMYYESRRTPPATEPTTVPLGLAHFGDDFPSLRRFAERDHAKIVSWHDYPHGGHWAPHQAPTELVADIQGFFHDLGYV